MGRVIAIDGPAASGKSTVAREVAVRTGFEWVSSGAFYRALTWWLLRQPGGLSSPLDGLDAQAAFGPCGGRFVVGEVAPVEALRSEAVNAAVSEVAQIAAVRALVGRELRRLAQAADCVVEGRDIGTCVFPETPYKFYIDATPAERARRRCAQGERDRLAERDRLDSQRTLAPLAAAPDAVVIDTTGLPVASVVARILEAIGQSATVP